MASGERHARIVVVDDNEDLRLMMGIALQTRGHEVLLASDAEEAFALIRQGPCDLVIADVVMHGGPIGLELISRISSELPPPAPPIIACSGFLNIEAEAIERGAWVFLAKPFATSDLFEAVERALADARPSTEAAQRMVQHSRAFRARAVEEAEAFLARIGERGAQLRRRAQWSARWVSSYFGFRSAAYVILRKGRLELAAANDDSLGEPLDCMEDRFPFCRDVLESGSSIVLPDVSMFQRFFQHRVPPTMRFMAVVPLRAPNGVAIGALWVHDDRPLQITAEDLSILEYIGRCSSAALGEAAGGRPATPFFSTESLLSTESFTGLLGLELRRARSSGGSLELAVVGVARRTRDGAWLDAVGAMGRGRRRALGDLGADRLAVFISGARRKRTSEELAAALEALDEAAVLRGAGVVTSLGDVGAALSEAELLRVAEGLFTRSLSHQGAIERLLIRSESARSSSTKPPVQRAEWD